MGSRNKEQHLTKKCWGSVVVKSTPRLWHRWGDADLENIATSGPSDRQFADLDMHRARVAFFLELAVQNT